MQGAKATSRGRRPGWLDAIPEACIRALAEPGAQ